MLFCSGDLWEEFGVKRASLKLGGNLELEALPTAFRSANDMDLQRIRTSHKALMFFNGFSMFFMNCFFEWSYDWES